MGLVVVGVGGGGGDAVAAIHCIAERIGLLVEFSMQHREWKCLYLVLRRVGEALSYVEAISGSCASAKI